MVSHETYWSTITDCNGAVEQELSYDAWGNLRDPETWCVDASITPMFDRGYTGHEHLNGFGLINMNGRMYDPVMSSFLSVDRYVQQPENSQGFNRYAYCMYNPLKYVDPSGWRLSKPEGNGALPPPDGNEAGYYITGVYTDTGFNSEYNCYSYTYGFHEVTVTPHGNSWAMEECRRLGEQNCGGLSAEYDGGEVNVPTVSAGGGGGGGMGTNYAGSPSKDYGIASNSLSYGVSYAGVVTGFIKDKWENPGSRAQKAINQKKAYKIQKTLKAKGITKSVKQIKAGKITSLKTGGTILGAVGVLASGYDLYMTNEIKPSHLYNFTASGTCLALGLIFTTSPVGWIAGAVFLGTEICSYAFTGQSFGENLDNWINWSHKRY